MNQQLHKIQAIILKELLLNGSRRFSQLNVTELENTHFNFHLKHLIEKGLVIKENSTYTLTSSGKTYVVDLDIHKLRIVEQGKISCLLVVVNTSNDEEKYLMHKRLKEPFYGKIGFPTAKVEKFEAIEVCAKRELYEETGLKVKKLHIDGVTHIIDLEQDLDVYYYRVYIENPFGELRNSIEGENYWMTEEQVLEQINQGNSFKNFKRLFMDFAVQRVKNIEEEYNSI